MAGLICVSCIEPDLAACRAALVGLDFAELRLDALAVEPAQLAALFAGHPRLVATCRPGRGRTAEQRAELLRAAAAAGAAYLDVDLDDPPALRMAAAVAARRCGCELIVSHHDFQATPDAARLRQLRQACFAAGAGLAKIACTPAGPRDNARLLGLLDSARPTVVVGMGPAGRPTRLLAPLLGAPFTYASLRPESPAAPGQIDHLRLRRWLDAMAAPGGLA